MLDRSERAPGEYPVVLHTRVVTGTGGGPDKTILNSPRHLMAHGYRALCAYMHPPDDPGWPELSRRAAELEAPLISVPDRGAFDIRILRQLAKICRRENVAIWHAHDYKSNLFGLLLRPFWPMKLVTTVHGWGVTGTRRLPIYYWIEKATLPRYAQVICVSDDLYETARKCGVAEQNCRLIENAIDLEAYRRSEPVLAAKRRLGLSASRLLIGAVGRLSPEKGYDLLIQTLPQLLSAGVDAEIAIVGDGPESERLDHLRHELEIADRVHLLGFRSDLVGIYSAFDVFALSSLSEGMPNVLLEAMALEVPAVATRVGAVEKLIAHGENGLLCSPNSAEALAEQLTIVAKRPDLRCEFAAKSRLLIEERYSFARRMERIRDVYDDVLNRKSVATAEAFASPTTGESTCM